MEKPLNGFEFLERLRKRNGKSVQNFNDLSRYLAYKARDKGIPYNGQFELTPLCNFNCRMCYVHLNPQQLSGRKILSPEIWKDLIHQAWEAGMCYANLTGGECLIYPGFKEIYLYLHSLGVQVGVLTNGFLLDEQWVQFFLDHKPAKIQITLYGSNDDVYERVTGQRAFSTVIKNIKKATEVGLPIAVTVTPNNYLGEDVFETVKTAKSLSKTVIVNACIFPPREETGRSEQQDNPETELYLRIYRTINELDGRKLTEIDEDKLPECGGGNHECTKRGLRCGGGRSVFVVDWKGNLMPCNRLDMIHASLLQDSFREAWLKVNREAENWPRVPECEGCPYDEICNNCAADMLRFAELGKRPDALCQQTRFFVKHGVRHIPECE